MSNRVSTKQVKEVQQSLNRGQWLEGIDYETAKKVKSWWFLPKWYWPTGKSYIVKTPFGQYICVSKKFWDDL